jgi:MarR family 2-MHQ and catechol resistance regulon transcriptional repressor
MNLARAKFMRQTGVVLLRGSFPSDASPPDASPPTPLGELSQRILLTGASTTYTVKKLEQRGLLTRRAKQEDQRVILGSITEKGRELMQHVFPLHAQDLARAMRALSVEEKRAAATILRKLQALNPSDQDLDSVL